MRVIDITRLKKNPDVIKSCFKTVKDLTMVTKNVRVIFPDRFIEKELAEIGNTVKTIALYAIVDDDNNYAVTIAPIVQELSPYDVNNLTVNGKGYKVLEFSEGDVFVVNNNLIKNEALLYTVFDELFVKGNIPFYLEYEDLYKVFLETGKYCDNRIGNNPLTFEILTSTIARDEKDKTIFYSQIVHTEKDKKDKEPFYIGLNNIYYSFDNTTSKLVGGYFGYGVTNAIVNKETEISEIGKILKGNN